MKQDVPPPYTAVTRHAVFPQASHDEAARFNFLTRIQQISVGRRSAPGNKLRL